MGILLEKGNTDGIVIDFEKYSEIDFLLVDDASTDNTLQILEQFSNPFSNVHFLQNPKNLGKAESIRQGVLQFNASKYEYLGLRLCKYISICLGSISLQPITS